MLVDDSAVIRGGLTALLENDPALKVVSSLSNGQLAVDIVGDKKPDIVILDIEMPVMDGLSALPKILEKSPSSRVIMFSALTERGAQVSLKALSLGAVECVVKPGPGEAKIGSEFQKILIQKIKHLAALAHAERPEQAQSTQSGSPQQSATNKPAAAPAPAAPKPNFTLRNSSADYQGRPDIIVIGSSTGGPQALMNVLKNMTGLTIPIVITQHMPATFTRILAQHLTQQTGLPTAEGENGMLLEPGKAYVAPGGFHMLFEKSGNGTTIKIDDGPAENFCKPAVDPMLRSLIPIYGRKILCVILTGMGNDGQKSAQLLVDAGGRVVAQDQQTSVVWGMPGAVAMAGVCSAVMPLNDIGPWVRKVATGL
ncbi:MAG: chemotaxis response regulator protein-glutamate methylesterase [Alphaproteobacteria bacterium]|nr:chemotaxis response regulator protein-glutamate methylesterase [Alphaproteobacteria bacterium]